MMKKISAMILCSLLLLCNGMNVLASDQQQVDPATQLREMQLHMTKMRTERPQKYQDMLQRARGKISGCLDCHVGINK